MKTSIAFVAVMAILLSIHNGEAVEQLSCKATLSENGIPQDWITMVDSCVAKVKNQVKEELTAAMTYFSMGTHFAKDNVNRPGFAKFFYESASEERGHAYKLIEYLMMRGATTDDINDFLKNARPKQGVTYKDGVEALKEALKLESDVTRKLRAIASACESSSGSGSTFNDYHFVDWLVGVYLEEQYKGQRELAGKISELDKMMKTNGPLGEYLFDKKMF